jgi:hypothetical protein
MPVLIRLSRANGDSADCPAQSSSKSSFVMRMSRARLLPLAHCTTARRRAASVKNGSELPLRLGHLGHLVQLRTAPTHAHYSTSSYKRTEGISIRVVSHQYGPENESSDDSESIRAELDALARALGPTRQSERCVPSRGGMMHPRDRIDRGQLRPQMRFARKSIWSAETRSKCFDEKQPKWFGVAGVR